MAWFNFGHRPPPPTLEQNQQQRREALERADPRIQERVEELSARDPYAAVHYQDAQQIGARLQWAQGQIGVDEWQIARALAAESITNPKIDQEIHKNSEGMGLWLHARQAGVSLDQVRNFLIEGGAQNLLAGRIDMSDHLGKLLDRLDAADAVMTEHYNRAARGVHQHQREKGMDPIEPRVTENLSSTRDLFFQFLRDQGVEPSSARPERSAPKAAAKPKAEKKPVQKTAPKPTGGGAAKAEKKTAPKPSAEVRSADSQAQVSLREPVESTRLAGIQIRYEAGADLERRIVELGKSKKRIEIGGTDLSTTIDGVRVRSRGQLLRLNGEELDLSAASGGGKPPIITPPPPKRAADQPFELGRDYQELIAQHGVQPDDFNRAAAAMLALRKEKQATQLEVLVPHVIGKPLAGEAFARLGELARDGVLTGTPDEKARAELAKWGVFLGGPSAAEQQSRLDASQFGLVKASFDLNQDPPLARFERLS